LRIRGVECIIVIHSPHRTVALSLRGLTALNAAEAALEDLLHRAIGFQETASYGC
jgi:hypothetical protein